MIYKRLKNVVSKAAFVKCFVFFGALSLVLPLTVNAATVNVWELDNWFSVEGGKSPDGKTTEIHVNVGDVIAFTNQGATDHDAVNDVVTLPSGTFFEGELFSGSPLQPGKTFTTPPFNEEGEIKFFCQIHGRDDMAGIIKVGDDDDDGGDDGKGGKSFTFKCENSLNIGRGPAGLEVLNMNIGDSESCTIKLTNSAPGKFVEVAVLLRAGFRSSISTEPASGMTDENGEIDVTITAVRPGIDWIAWAVPNKRGEMAFGKRAVDDGLAWGMFVDVSD